MKTSAEKNTQAVSFRLIAFAAVALFLGLLLYIMIRPQGSALLIPVQLQLSLPAIPLLTLVNGSLPTFLHVYAFVLLTAALLNLKMGTTAIASLSWFLTHTLFEIGQIRKAALWFHEVMPNWMQRFPPLHHLQNYFILGTFDWLDILAAASGAVSAFVTVTWTLNKRRVL